MPRRRPHTTQEDSESVFVEAISERTARSEDGRVRFEPGGIRPNTFVEVKTRSNEGKFSDEAPETAERGVEEHPEDGSGTETHDADATSEGNASRVTSQQPVRDTTIESKGREQDDAEDNSSQTFSQLTAADIAAQEVRSVTALLSLQFSIRHFVCIYTHRITQAKFAREQHVQKLRR